MTDTPTPEEGFQESLEACRQAVLRTAVAGSAADREVLSTAGFMVREIRAREQLDKEGLALLGRHFILAVGYIGGLALCDTAKHALNVLSVAGYYLHEDVSLHFTNPHLN